MIGYSCQLYFDFSGYSTMAVGLGYLFGLRIPQNFNSPYKALDPSDFWRRWHISLSTCMRDYLYIPLGESGDRLADFPKPHAHDADRGTLAWRGVDLRGLGGLSRPAAGGLPQGGAVVGPALGRNPKARDVAARGRGLGPVSLHRFRDGGPLLRTMFLPAAGDLVPNPVFSALFLAFAALWATAGTECFRDGTFPAPSGGIWSSPPRSAPQSPSSRGPGPLRSSTSSSR